MSVRARRQLGVTFLAVLRSTRQLTTDPAFEPANLTEMAEAVLEHITGRTLPQLRRAQLDVDALIEWITRLLPLILQILELFALFA